MGATPTKADRRRRAIALPIAVAAIAAGGLTTLTSGAIFTDADTVENNTFTSGTIDLVADKTVDFVAPNMAPGDVVTGTINVKNAGTLEQRYAVTSTYVGDKILADALVVDVTSGGKSVYNGPLSAFKFGDPTQGAQAGDRVLAAAAAENLEFKVTLPIAADNALQGKTVTATFDFAAEQTKNN
ncbi:TasA family protein [Nocardioides pakistanensis]